MGLFAASFYLNNTQGNLLRQLCYSSLDMVSEEKRPIPELYQLGAPRFAKQRVACTYQGDRAERGFIIKTYSLGPYDLEYELDRWSFFRSEVERLRGAYIKGQDKERVLRLKINPSPVRGNLVPDYIEHLQK